MLQSFIIKLLNQVAQRPIPGSNACGHVDGVVSESSLTVPDYLHLFFLPLQKNAAVAALLNQSSLAITPRVISAKHLAAGEAGIRVASPMVRKLSVEKEIACNGAILSGRTSSGKILMPR